ncbi:hypothetical protein AC1031_004781 [Aphanomyces cochlioides]|nr:hypothetical protein AC1031_004781 [Aphanomyces cochlioides]
MLLEQAGIHDEKIARQTRRTILQRERREREKNEVYKLKVLVARLENERRQWAKKSSHKHLLSWDQVAIALHEDTYTALNDNSRLRQQRQRLLNVITGMTKWIASAKGIARGPHTLPYSASHLSLHHVTLTASDPLCRQHGLDWLTQLLYHNTEALLHRYNFWSHVSTEAQCDFHTDMSNMNDIQLVWRFQVDIPAELEAVVDPVRKCVVNRLRSIDIWDGSTSYIDPEIVSRVSPTMTYIRRIAHTNGGSQPSNILYREFNEDANRTVFVGQNLHDDKFEIKPVRNKGMTWVVATRLGTSWTRVSILSVSSLYFNDKGFLPLTEQASRMGLALSPSQDRHEASFVQQTQMACNQISGAWLEYLKDAVRTAQTNAKLY